MAERVQHDERYCASTRCGRADGDGTVSHRRGAAPGARLCAPCKSALVRDLAALPDLHDESEQYLGTGAPAGFTQRITGSRERGLPVNSGALEARHDVVVRLAAWTQLVLDEVPSAGAPRRTVADMAALLGRHADWLAAHPAAGAVADEVAGGAAALRSLSTPRPAGLIPLGDCAEPGCTAQVSMAGRGGDEMVLRGPVCGAGHVLTPTQQLAKGETADARPRRVPTELAALALGVQTGTIRMWVRRGKLTRYGTRQSALYDLAELTALAREHGAVRRRTGAEV
ncbi:hypothetical protein NLX86_19560 [Streptomyces sp. A3M-1-3]|uniref:hypothetical protein n=1 Tax=Streptomyces sp. A3M-1-3 TaxID=2962044 RepID=UPI0020B8C8AF|nr:hypothetical protein [Streptomyces sp. A3M-1-3]MCP3820215.1 hypothetical protein [Streptomyces sp. A3M-1-3]